MAEYPRTEGDAAALAALAAHEADTSVHGILDTSVLATDSDVASEAAARAAADSALDVALALASPAGAFVTSTLTASFPDAALVPIVFDTVVADNNGFWNPSQPTRLTVHKPGLYYIKGNVEFTADTAGERLVLIFKNGAVSALGHGESFIPSTFPTDTPQVHAGIAAVLADGDYVELKGQAVGISTTVTSRHVPPITPQFAIFYQGPA